MNHWADYVIFAIFIAISLGIGLFHALTGGRQRTTEEFIMADRKLKVLPTTISLLVSYQSAIMIIGGTAEVYTGGTQAWLWGILSFIVSMTVVQGLVVPWLYRLKLTSVFRLFWLRFGHREVQFFGAVMGIIGAVVYMATATLAPSIALQTATGFPMFVSIPIMAFACIIYTALGGMKAVIWTDVFQFVIMLAGMLTIAIKAFMVTGGVKKAFQYANSEDRIFWADFDPNPTVRHTAWGFMVGWGLMWTFVYGMAQSSVQRYSAVHTLKKAKLVLWLNLPAYVVMGSLSALIGVGVCGYYTKIRCDPLASGIIQHSNEFLPLFVRDVFKNVPGFGGLFLATLYSGALSSVSSSLSAAAAITWDDLLKLWFPHLSERQAATVNRACVVIYGLVAVGLTFMISFMSGHIMQIAISLGSSINGPMLGLFIVSSLRIFSFCRSRCVLIAGIISAVMSFWLAIGGTTMKNTYAAFHSMPVDNCNIADNVTAVMPNVTMCPANVTSLQPESISGFGRFYSLSYLWYGLYGTLIVVILSAVFSFVCNCIQKPPERDIPDGVFMEFPCLSLSWFKKDKKYQAVKDKEVLNVKDTEMFTVG